MSEKFNVLQGAMASSERIFALLDTPVDSRVARARVAVSVRAEPDRGGVPSRFEHVSFSYVPRTSRC